MADVGQCHKCCSFNLKYKKMKIDEVIEYPFVCKDCKSTGVEIYSLTYIETKMD